MADISQIQLRGGATYDIKDETARAAIPSNVSDLPNDAGYITGMTILSYGSSTWQDFLDAYNANKVIYCRASSNSNPATGTQGRMAFMAFVEFSSSTPRTVEFQYYRSVSSHSDSQQGDQVFIYKLTNAGVWSVTTREAYTKIAVGAGMSKVYSSGTLTLSSTVAVPSASDATPAALGTASAGSSSNYSRADHVHQKPTYTAADVGALPANTAIPSKTSDLTNDSGFISSETDPTVPSWAKASSKPTYTASEVGAFPSSEAHPFILQNNVDYFATPSDLPASATVGTLAFLESSPVLPADYIIEQGVNSGWEYKKWNSGLAECYKVFTDTNLSYSAWGSGYYATVGARTLPSGLFTSVRDYVPTLLAANDCWLGSPLNNDSTITTSRIPPIMVLRFTNYSNASATIGYHVYGSWK